MYSTIQSIQSGHWLRQFHISGTIALVVLFGISSVSNLFSQESQAGRAVVTAKKIPNRSAGSYFNELRGTAALPLNVTEKSSRAADVPLFTLSVPPTSDSFAGFDFDDNTTQNGANLIPANPSGAAGTASVIGVGNAMIEARTKTGGLLWIDSLKDFFAPANGVLATTTFNAKVIYDQYEDRFLVVALERFDSGLNPHFLNKSRILLAVSKDDTPTSSNATDWHFLAIDAKTTIQALDHWADFPGLAIDEEAVYITANMFPFTGATGTFGVRLWIIDKNVASGFYSGGTAAVTVHDPYAGSGSVSVETTTMPAHVFGAGGVTGGVGTFLVSYSSITGGGANADEFVQVVRVDAPLGTPTFTHELVNVGDLEDVGGAFGSPDLPDAPQKDSNQLIEVNDSRALNAVWRNNALWLVATINPNAAGDPTTGDVDVGQATAHWFKLNTATAPCEMTEQGNVGGEEIADGTFTFFPSIAVNNADTVKIGFSASGPNIFPGAFYIDPLAASPLPGVLHVGEDFYVRKLGGNENSWGDYSGISVDPAADTNFWIFNQYAMARGTLLNSEDGRWATHWGKCDPTGAPAAVINVTPLTIDFDTVFVTLSATKTVTIINHGNANLDGITISTPGGAPFTTTALSPSPPLAPFDSATFDVTFQPTVGGLFNASLIINSDGGNVTLSLTGVGDDDFEPAGTGICYATAVNAAGKKVLITIDPVTGVGAEKGETGLQNAPGLAITSAGEIFAAEAYETTAELNRIDAATGITVPVAMFPTGVVINALAFDENDLLYGIDNASNFNLVTINTLTADTTIVGAIGTNIVGLAFDPTTGALWGSFQDSIYVIDKTTGKANLVGTTGLSLEVPDIHFADSGNLFGVSADTLISIDKTNGAGTIIGTGTGFDNVDGMAFRNTFSTTPSCEPFASFGPAIFPTPEAGQLGEPIKPVTGAAASSVSIDIRLKENPNDIDAFGFTVKFDPSKLTFVKASAGDLTASFDQLSCQETNSAGTLICGGFENGTDIIKADTVGVLVRLSFTVDCAAGSSEITISNLTDDIVDFAGSCNIIGDCITCVNDGNVNNDTGLTPGDALCAFDFFLNAQALTKNCDVNDFQCEVIAGDVNCDGTVTPGDALAIFQRFLDGNGSTLVNCFAQVPSTLTKPAEKASSYNLSLNQRMVLTQEDQIKIVLVVDNPDGLDAFGFNFSYPSDKLEFVGLERTDLTADWIQLEGQSHEAGMLIVGGFNDQPLANTASAELLQLVFNTKDRTTTSADFKISGLVDDFRAATLQSKAGTSADLAFVPEVFSLYQNYPNPFNPETRIRFDIPAGHSNEVQIRLSIYNVTGQLVRVLLDENRAPGSYEILWDGRKANGIQMSTGMFFYSIHAGNFKDTKKMLFLK